jgi:hypothetical protein
MAFASVDVLNAVVQEARRESSIVQALWLACSHLSLRTRWFQSSFTNSHSLVRCVEKRP